MTDNIQQNLSEEIKTKKLTTAQVKHNIEREKRELEKKLLQLNKRYQRESEKEEKQKLRKVRNKKIYNMGGLLTTILGNDTFDKFVDNQDNVNLFIGTVIEMMDELSASGYGVQDGKMTTSERRKNKGRDFMIKRKG